MRKQKLIRFLLLVFAISIAEITWAQCPTLTITNVTNVSCFGGFNGGAQLQIVNSPLSPCVSNSIMWSTGETGTSIVGKPAGIYYVYVTNNCTGCTSFAIAIINQPFQLFSTITSQDADCYNVPMGVADLEVSGGSIPYSYVWSNGSNSQDLINVLSGSYFVTVTDANGCVTNNQTVINQPPSAITSNVIATGVSCYLGNDGAADLTPAGGTPPYVFNWTPGNMNSEDVSGLTQGTYNVVITDSKGCAQSSTAIINQPPALISSITGYDVLCNGSSTGSADLTVSGGTSPYAYAWASATNMLGNVQDLNSVVAGNYHVTVTDNKGCTREDSIIIYEPLPLLVSETHVDVNCYGGTDGSIILTPSGGTLPFTYQWANSVGALPNVSSSLSNIPAETYMVTVTDFNGCTKTKTISVTQPSSPLSLTETHEHVTCFGGNNGNIDVSIQGGTTPYSFLWSNGAISEDVSLLLAGNYSLLMTDANGCNLTFAVTINQPSTPVSITSAVTDVNCFGGTDGDINITTSGGTPPYQYSWVNSSFVLSLTQEDAINFPADMYWVTILDSQNCELVDSFSIQEPPQIVFDFQTIDVKCYGEATGIIDLSVTGGVSPYQYAWNNGSVSQDLILVPTGSYAVTVTDIHNCTMIDSQWVSQPIQALGSTQLIEQTSCAGYADGSAQVIIEGGTAPYQYNWTTGSVQSVIQNVTSGNYYLTVTDSNLCLFVDTIFVPQPDFITPNATIDKISCNGYANGIIHSYPQGGNGGYQFDWANSTYVLNEFQPVLDSLKPDTYFLTITDSVGCFGEFTFLMTQPQSIDPNVTKQNITCFGEQDGFIETNPIGGTAPLTFQWSNGSTASRIDNLSAGFYAYSIIDSNMCVRSDSIEIVEPQPITLYFEVTQVSCKDQLDGEVLISTTGGSGGFTYQLNGSSYPNPATGLAGGGYQIVVSDVFGCTGTGEVTVPVNTDPCLDIVNTFTPNSDGINDTWIIDELDLFTDVTIQIFNEWGRIMYEDDGSKPWDGTFNGNPLPTGTYYYLITVSQESEPYTGSVTLIR